MDIPTILAIVSIIFTAILATHITVSSNCFGVRTQIESNNGKLEIEVDLGSETIETTIDEHTGQTSIQVKNS